MFIVSDSDLAFNQPTVTVKIDRTKARDLGISMQNVGSALAVLLGGNYVNRFNLEGTFLPGHSAGAARQAPVAGIARRLLCVTTSTGQQVPLSTVVSIDTKTDPRIR